MKFSIPKKFKLGAITIAVNKVKKITDQTIDCDGMAFYDKSLIELKDNEESSNDYKEYVFFHELVHHIFNVIEEDSLRIDEKIVSRFAIFLHQAIRTME